MTPPPSDQIESPDEPEPSTVDAAQDSRTTNIRQRLSAGLSKALDPVRDQVADLRDQVEKFTEEQVERKDKRESAHAKREAEKEAERAAAPSAQAAIDDQCRVHAETGIHPVVAAQREEFREALNGLLNPEETLVEFVDAFSVNWVFAPNPSLKGTYKDRHQGTHHPVRAEVWLALTSERLRIGKWAVGMVPSGIGHNYEGRDELFRGELSPLDEWLTPLSTPAYPYTGFGYSDAWFPVPEVFASETIEIKEVRRVQVATSSHQEGYLLDTDLQGTVFDNAPPRVSAIHLGLGEAWHERLGSL